MTIQLGWGELFLAGLILVIAVWLGAILEYIWHAVHHRHH